MYVVLQTSQIEMNTSGKHFPSMGKAPTATKITKQHTTKHIRIFFYKKERMIQKIYIGGIYTLFSRSFAYARSNILKKDSSSNKKKEKRNNKKEEQKITNQ